MRTNSEMILNTMPEITNAMEKKGKIKSRICIY